VVPAGTAVAATASAATANSAIVTIAKGSTLESTLVAAGATRAEASEAARAIAKQTDLRKLQPGQLIEVRFSETGSPPRKKLWTVRLPLTQTKGLIATASSSSFAVRPYDPARPADLLPAGTLPRIEGGAVARSAVVKQGETLSDVARALGAKRAEADRAIAGLSKLFNVRRLQIGQTITLTFSDSATLIGLAIALEGGIEVAAYLSDGGEFEPLKTTAEERLQMAAEAEALRAQQLRSATAPAAVALAPVVPAPATLDLAIVTDTVQRGDTLLEVAMRLGADGGDALTASMALSSLFNLRMLRVGQLVTAVFGRRDSGELTRLLALSITVDQDEEIIALLTDGGRFEPVTTTPEGRDKLIAQAQATPAPSPAEPAPLQVAALPPDAIPPMLAKDPAERPPTVIGIEHQVKTLIVSRGDTLLDAAVGLGARYGEATEATRALAEIFDPRSLKVGQIIEATFGRVERGAERRLLALTVAVKSDLEVAAFLSERGQFAPREISREEHDQLLAAPNNAAAPTPPAVATPATAARAPVPAAAAPAPAPAARAPQPAASQPHFDWIATIDRTVAVRPGDTLMEAVLRTGATQADAHEAITALTKIFNPRQLQAGQSIQLTFGNEENDRRLLAVNLRLDVEREVVALRARTGAFSPQQIVREFDVRALRASGIIDDSLYVSAERAGVPINTIMEMIRVFSWDVDFQRDIRTGDRFEVFYDEYVDEHGKRVKDGNIRYAALTLSGTQLRLYRYEGADGIIDYYNEAGASVRKALLRTPIDGARLSSTFGMRRHPILAFSRMHQGVDFAAPAGTPIKAAGDGVIEIAAPNSGYGNYVMVRHNSEYKTVYAHLSSFAKGIAPGVRVRQGQTIGYVGSTGLATGPHLHYEILQRGRQVNPASVKFPTGKTLEGRELAQFRTTKAATDTARLAAPELTTLAAR
jgi:murein DD-endopeptidase MepM/ murein hydrolase activator NlpD